ncbi:MAG TPA: leucine-rich repeat domain-containing protein, partial [Candidatus Stercoripulliclostridium merdigallinarum]|nr:leucine-rich repeat domain-containing protein [Candidatus Stercoripulliclostridium merdigallinarum]
SASDLVAVYFPEGSALVPQNDALPEEADPDSDDVGYDFTNYFIGEKVFGGCVKLTTVYTSFTLDNGNIVPSDNPGLGIISDYMFYNCKALKTVQIAEGLRLIGALAFASDSANAMKDLTTVSFPAALEVLGQQAFANTNLSSVSFSPQSEFRILGDWAFQGTEIASATFYSLTEYGKAPFWGNLAINSVYIYSDRVPDISVPSLTDMGDTSVTQTRFYVPITQLSDYRSKWGSQYSSGGLFQDYSLQIADLILAAEYENRNAGYALEPVDEDGDLQADGNTDYAKVVYLYYNGKTSLSVPETADVTINGITKYFTVTDIGGYVTVDSAATSPILTDRVTEIYLPDTVKRISDYAFYNMGKLSKLIWTYIGEGGFTMNYGQGVVDNLSLRSIGDYAFYATALETFYSSPQLTYIGAEAFADSKLHSVDLTKCDGLTIAASAFSGNKIVNLTIGSGVAELQRYCFANQDTGTAPMRIEFKGAPPTVETNLDPFGGNIVGTVVVPEAFYYKFVEDDISSALRGKYVKG